MPEVAITFRFCYGHRLMGYEGKCNRLHGHNARVIVTFTRPTLDEQGFVVDFAKAKSLVNMILDRQFDHFMFLEAADPAAYALGSLGEVLVTLDVPPTVENLARKLFGLIAGYAGHNDFGPGVSVTCLEMFETDGCSTRVRSIE